MSSPADTPRVERTAFGRLDDGEAVERFTLTNPAGLRLEAVAYGGAITRLEAPDRAGRAANVVLGYATLAEYVADRCYVGTLIGRYSNRIAGSRFELDGRVFALPPNEGANHLHGGPAGFHKRLWAGEAFVEGAAAVLVLRRTSPDGEAGYPGSLQATATYRWSAPATLEIDLVASTDRATPVSLTHHGYYNLAGHGGIDAHLFQIEADAITPTDASLIPLGRLDPVAGTPLDFREPRRLAGDVDQNYALRRSSPGLAPAAVVVEPGSGRSLHLSATEPGLHFYTGQSLEAPLRPRSGFCLEPQQFPDAPNQPAFPSPVLRPDQEYRSRMRFVFGIADAA